MNTIKRFTALFLALTLPGLILPVGHNAALTFQSPSIVFLDAGGDQVQAINRFGTVQGSGTMSFDTSQKVNGVGSWKFDSGGSNQNISNKVSGVLGTSRRIDLYFRLDSIPNTDSSTAPFPGSTSTAYSGGGFLNDGNLVSDNGLYATATPAQNSGQGNALTAFNFGGLPQRAVIDSVKIIYERKYDIATSAGISRVKWRIGGVEGPDHDNTDMPLTDTVVEVDVTNERTWELTDFDSNLEIIAEARRGDSVIAHVQSWDYVKLQIEFHTSIEILTADDIVEAHAFSLHILPSGSTAVLRLVDGAGLAYDGITKILPDTDHRIALSYIHNATNDLDIKLFVNGIEELWLDELNTASIAVGSIVDFAYGWNDPPGANQVCWFDQLYIDDGGSDLSDRGPIYMTAKLPTTVNTNDFDTTGGTGAVDERPLSETNYKQHAATAQKSQNYNLQAASVGDVDLTGKTLLGYMGWAWAKRGSGAGVASAGITLNGATTGITLGTTSGLFKTSVMSSSYPSNAAAIGLRSTNTSQDSFLYECGVIVAYVGPPDDILFAYQEVAQDTTATGTDDVSAILPTTYMVRYWCYGSATGRVEAKIYTKASAEAPYVLRLTQSNIQNEEGGQLRIPNNIGIEVKVEVTATLANMSIGLAGYPNV